MLSLSSARQLAARCLQRAQVRYKKFYDNKIHQTTLRVGDWVLIHFPSDESGRLRKLSRPWHGPYRIVDRNDPDVTCVKVYHPQDGPLQVHQSRVCHCPADFPAGYYRYGGKRKGPGRPPKWVDRLLQSGAAKATQPDSTNHRNDDNVDNRSASEADSPASEEDQLMKQHLQPRCLQPSNSQSLDSVGFNQDQIDYDTPAELDHTLDPVNDNLNQADSDDIPSTKNCDGSESNTRTQSGDLGTNVCSKSQPLNETASATDKNVNSAPRETLPAGANQSCQYSSQQSPCTTDSQLQSPDTGNNGTL